MLRRIYWGAWLAGTALILLSWTQAVSPTIGWVGFWVACCAAFLSYIRWGAAKKTADWAILSRPMVEARDHGYERAVKCLRDQGTVFYEGMALAARPGDDVVCSVAASWPATELDELRVQQDVERARAQFEALSHLSPEIAALTCDKRLQVSLLSEFGEKGFEICRVVDGSINWKSKWKR